MADEYYQIPENPQFSVDDIRKMLNSDPGNAETVFNPLILRLLTNIAALKELLDAAGEDTGAALSAAAEAKAAAEASAPVYPISVANGGTGKTSEADALYALINGAAALTSSGLATGDYIPIGDVSATTGKKVTLANLAAFLSGSGGLRIATGSYAGDGGTSKTINIGFTPKFVAITVDGSEFDCKNSSNAYNIVYARYIYDAHASLSKRHLAEAIYTGQPSELIYGEPDITSSAHFYKRNYSVSGSGITITGTREETYSQNPRSSAAEGYYIMNNSNYKYRWVAIG